MFSNPDQEPPGKSHVSAAARSGWNDSPNWPVIYSIGKHAGESLSPNGGVQFTIEGANFGSILSSFGEEDREDHQSIRIYFQGRNNGGGEAECHELTHYHNPTQLFCRLERWPTLFSWYDLFVEINGHQANHHCGCKGNVNK